MVKGDKILIITIIIICVVSLGFIKNSGNRYNTKYISIQVDGKEYKRITFDKSISGKKVPIETQFGYNLIEIGDGEVWVIEASCPDKLDVKQGKISKPGQIIVCLPNKLVIEIKGSPETVEIDYIGR